MILHLVQPVRHSARQVCDGVGDCCAGVGHKAFVVPVMERVPKIFGNFRILQPSMPGEGGTANTVRMDPSAWCGRIGGGEIEQARGRLSVQLIDDKLLHVDAFQCRIAKDA